MCSMGRTWINFTQGPQFSMCRPIRTQRIKVHNLINHIFGVIWGLKGIFKFGFTNLQTCGNYAICADITPMITRDRVSIGRVLWSPINHGWPPTKYQSCADAIPCSLGTGRMGKPGTAITICTQLEREKLCWTWPWGLREYSCWWYVDGWRWLVDADTGWW